MIARGTDVGPGARPGEIGDSERSQPDTGRGERCPAQPGVAGEDGSGHFGGASFGGASFTGGASFAADFGCFAWTVCL